MSEKLNEEVLIAIVKFGLNIIKVQEALQQLTVRVINLEKESLQSQKKKHPLGDGRGNLTREER
jgi:hypothetical protein